MTGCKSPPKWASKWPEGLDLLWKATQHARARTIMQFFLEVTESSGATHEQQLRKAPTTLQRYYGWCCANRSQFEVGTLEQSIHATSKRSFPNSLKVWQSFKHTSDIIDFQNRLRPWTPSRTLRTSYGKRHLHPRRCCVEAFSRTPAPSICFQPLPELFRDPSLRRESHP